MHASVAISRSVLSDQVRDRLLRAILDGRYAPGTRIVETHVAREYGTSQAPVREALRDLEGLGLVEMQPFRGARVRRPGADELVEAFTVRAALEAYAAALALPHLRDEDVAALAADVEAMRVAARGDDGFALAEADARFHGRLVACARNATLARLWPMLEASSRTVITAVPPGPGRLRIAELHVPIVEALAGREPVAVRDAIDEHFRHLAEMVSEPWPDGPPARS